MKFAVLSDTHYISRRMIADPDNKELNMQPAVTEQAILQAAKEADLLLITGDLTDRGDRYSHEDFSAFLNEVKAKGTKIYVLFATHDFNHHKTYTRKFGEKIRYKSEPWAKPWVDMKNILFDVFLFRRGISASDRTDKRGRPVACHAFCTLRS